VSAPFPRAVYLAGAAALTPFGAGWRDLAARIAGGAAPASADVPALAPGDDPCEPRHRKMMSRAAYLAAAVVRAALREAAVAALDLPPAELGCFLGVGASGGEIPELEAILRESVAGGAFRLDRFGDAGLRAANPLFAFQLMNNFTLCHAAILAGLEGPNAAFFSRGAGTVRALREAAFAVADGDAPAALAGGADSALYPVTAFELARAAAHARPSEAAAVLTLSARPAPIRLLHADVISHSLAPRSGERVGVSGPYLVVVTASDPDARAALARDSAGDATEVLVLEPTLGETLAAAPAVAWTVAFDWLAARPRGQARVVSRGLDGELGVVDLAKEDA
jgi:hypothetical protein